MASQNHFIIALITGKRGRNYCGLPIIMLSTCFCDVVIVVVPFSDRYMKWVTYMIVITF